MLIVVTGLYVSVHYFKSACVKEGGINPRQVEVSLRKRPNISSKTVTTLGAGDFANLTEPERKWNYFYSVNHRLAVQKKNFKLGYSRVFGIFVLKTKQLKFYEKQTDAFAPYFIISLSVLLFFFSLARFKKRHQKNDSSHSYNAKEPLESVYYTKPQLSSNRELTSQVTMEYVEPLPIDQEQEEFRAIEAYIFREDEKEELKKEVEAFFYHKAKKELATITAAYQNNMAEMARTIFSLKEKYNDAEKKAAILGVDLNDSNIDNLVKGRLFELFTATIWDGDYRTEIDDWTPDKGFNENIYIKSNGNPDFVVSFMDSSKVVAVECKFRSRFKEAVFVDFGKEKSIKRYKKYEAEKNMTVFILLGVGGVAEQPENLYLLTLSELDEIKHIDGFDNIATTQKKIDPYEISKNRLIDCLFE